MKVLGLFLLSFIFLAYPTGVFPQDKPANISEDAAPQAIIEEKKPATETAEQQIEKEEASPSEIKTQEPEISQNKTTPAGQVKKIGSVDKEQKAGDKQMALPADDIQRDGGLLFINDDYTKYSRIPDINIKKGGSADKDDFVKLSGSSENIGIDTEKIEPTGLFGLSKRATDTLALGTIIFIIVVIFVLYRSRSGTARRRALRSYRKK